LKALLDEDPYPTQEEFAESLGVAQSTIFMHLKALRMIQTQGNWKPYKLKPRDLEKRFFMCEQLFQWQKQKGFLHHIVTGDGYTMITQSEKSHGLSPCINNHGKAEYLCLQAYVLYLVRSAGYRVLAIELLQSKETIRAVRYRLQLIRLS